MTANRLPLAAALLASTALLPAAADAADQPVATQSSLEAQFRDPPNSARPRVWWHWMNGNVTKDGIAKDLAWMKRVGVGGLQNFDIGLSTPQIVERRLPFMSPGWKDAFRFAASEAERLDLELAIAASPGWSETGGPWVEPADALKKVVWSEQIVDGGVRYTGKLPLPPRSTGTYLDLPVAEGIALLKTAPSFVAPERYSDFAVLAVPCTPDTGPAAEYTIDGVPLDAAALADRSLLSGVSLPRSGPDAPVVVTATFAAPRTVRSASLFIAGAKAMHSSPNFAAVLEASVDGTRWQRVGAFSMNPAPTTIGFPAVTATRFRLTITPLVSKASNPRQPVPGLATNSGSGAAPAPKPVDLRQFALSSDARIDQFEAKAGFAVEPDYYALGNPDPASTGPAPTQVVDLTSRMQADGSIDWTPPKGTRWKILRFGSSLLGTTNHPATAEATGLEVDKYDGQAVQRYLEHYLSMYRDVTGPLLFGKHGVRALITDSIEVGAANWTPKMLQRFRELRGYDPVPWLPALAGVLVGTREQSDRFLWDYRQTLADLIASEHYGTIAKVAHEQGLQVYGEALELDRPSLGDDMAMRSHADVPMAALWTFGRSQGPNLSHIADIRGAASVAHLLGRNVVAAESMTSASAPWFNAPKDLRRIVDLEFVNGVNRPVIHTSVHQPVDNRVPGLSLLIFGQYFNRHEAWGEMARPWVDYMARSSMLLQSGRNVADVAIFYGEEGPLTTLYGHPSSSGTPKVHAFDFLNRDSLLTAIRVEEGEIVSSGGARYKALYLGGASGKMTVATLRRIAELAEAGATIIGEAPTDSPSLDDDRAAFSALTTRLWGPDQVTRVGRGRVIAMRDVDGALASMGVRPDFRLEGAAPDTNIPFVHRSLPDGELWFLVNRKDRQERVSARFRIAGKVPELWHADTGRTEPVSYSIRDGETVVPLDLAAEESVFVVFRKPAAKADLAVPQPRMQRVMDLNGPWTVNFQPGRGAPPSIQLKSLHSLSDDADPGVRYFSGEATYSQVFVLPRSVRPGASLWLNLGEVSEVAEVKINGKIAGTAWHAPYRIKAGQLVRTGKNRLEIKVANLWVNRLIGDAQPGAQKITWTATPTYRADAPLRRSGLIGPVTLNLGGR